MPLTLRRTFRVRYYECDPAGRLRPASLLRYMQETAFDASAAAGYGIARYEAMGRIWLVRETELEVLRLPGYGDRLAVTTWVADFRRVRSRRAYEFRLAESGEMIARATTDWVFLDRSTLRPALIPPEMKAAFFPKGVPEAAPARRRFPQPPPPDGESRCRRRVQWSDLDQAGHVNNAVYLDYIEDCGVELLTAEGLTLTARQHRIEYRQPALPGDELEIVAWFAEGPGEQRVRHTQIRRSSDGALLVRARAVY